MSSTANGARLDKQGKPISLRLLYPNTDSSYDKTAQFVKSWYKDLGIKVSTQPYDSSTLADIVLPPEACPKKDPNCPEYRADYDIELWGWAWGPDPNGMTQIFRCDYIGSSSDSQYCNPEYDKLYDEQATATSDDARHAILAEMQNLIYDEAPYDVLFYDSALAAYRTDKFAGWQNQPLDNGTPLFTYGTLQYTLLTDATKVEETPPPAAESLAPGETAAPTVAPTPAPSGDDGTAAGDGDNTALIIAAVVVIVIIVVVGLMLARRRSGSGEEEE